MKPSRRNLTNAQLKAEKLSDGPPVVSKFARKNMTEEQYAAAMRAEATIRTKSKGISTR